MLQDAGRDGYIEVLETVRCSLASVVSLVGNCCEKRCIVDIHEMETFNEYSSVCFKQCAVIEFLIA